MLDVASYHALQELDTGNAEWAVAAGHSSRMQKWVEWVHRNQEAESFPLAMSLQHFLLTKLKSSQLAKEIYFKDLDAFSQNRFKG